MFAKGLAIGKTIDYRLRPLVDHFGNRPLAEIRTADVEDFIADLRKPKIAGRRKKRRTLSPASINRTIEIMRHMMNWAVGREYLDRTPFRRGTETLIRKLREDNRRRRRISEEEEGRLLAVAPPLLRSMLTTALDTGTRQGEMLALRFGDIDFARGLITLRGETTKSKNSRPVPIATATLRAVLEWLQLEADGTKKPDDALVSSDEAGEPEGRFRTAWVTVVLKVHGIKPVWKAYGWTALTPPCLAEFRRINLQWHDLRHEYASRLVEKGVPLAQVRDLLGHAYITTTERYDNQKLENLQAAAARLERGATFTPPPVSTVEATPRTSDRKPRSKHRSPSNRQDFVKSWGDQHPEAGTDREPETNTNSHADHDLADWLGGSDSNPDNVVARERCCAGIRVGFVPRGLVPVLSIPSSVHFSPFRCAPVQSVSLCLTSPRRASGRCALLVTQAIAYESALHRLEERAFRRLSAVSRSLVAALNSLLGTPQVLASSVNVTRMDRRSKPVLILFQVQTK